MLLRSATAKRIAVLLAGLLAAATARTAAQPIAPEEPLLHRGVLGDAAQSPAPEIPSARELRSRSRSSHPRLLVPPARIETLKTQIAAGGLAARWYEAVKSRADEHLAAAPSEYEIPDGLRLLYTSRRVLERVRDLALVYRIEGGERYAERAWAELEAAAAFPDWNPRHFLDVGEMTYAFALGYDWFYNYWSDRQRERLRQAIVTHGLEPAMAAYEDRADWEGWKGWVQAPMNWNQVCNGGIGMGALVLLDERPQLASRVLHEALSNLPYALEVYAPDGGWDEGPAYWGYGTRYLTFVLSSLETTFGEAFGLATMPGVPQTGWFPPYMTGPLGISFNFGDADPERVRGPQLLWLAQRFEEPAFARYQKHVAEPTAMNLLWLTPSFETLGPLSEEVSLDKYFAGPEVAVFRSGWRDTSAFLGVKAGSNAAPHTNLDLGTFVFDALGTRWAAELGRDDYNLPGYFEKEEVGQRWTYYRVRTEGQNTLVLNPGVAETNQNTGAEASLVRRESSPQAAFAIADLTPAYAANVRSVRRGVRLGRAGGSSRAIIQDEIRSEAPVDGWWFMHTRATVEIGADSTRATLRRDGQRLQAVLLTPEAGRFTVRPAAPLASSPDPEGQSENEGVRKLSIRLQGMTNERIAVALIPLGRGPSAPDERPEVRALEDW